MGFFWGYKLNEAGFVRNNLTLKTTEINIATVILRSSSEASLTVLTNLLLASTM